MNVRGGVYVGVRVGVAVAVTVGFSVEVGMTGEWEWVR